MKKSLTKIVSVVIVAIMTVAAFACFASAAPVVDGCDCECCEYANSTDGTNTNQGDRDIFLVLDISGSMKTEPIAALKEAAKDFCSRILADTTGDNRIVIITYNTNVTTYSFSTDYDALAAIIDGFVAQGATSMYDALMAVKEIDENYGRATASKHVVVMADGCPNTLPKPESGKYTEKDNSMYWASGNAVYSTAAGMWYDYDIYSVGFFHDLTGRDLKFASTLMNDIQNKLYLEVYDPDKLLEAFTGVADAILGTCICDDDCDCGLYGCCECCTGPATTAPADPCEGANDDGSCNCDNECTCGDICYCGDDCRCDSAPCENANDDGSCNCAEACTCGDDCDCGENCTCGETTTAETTTAETTTAETTTETTTTKPIAQTSDTSIGIAAAAAVMLAGIAVVATKKRED